MTVLLNGNVKKYILGQLLDEKKFAIISISVCSSISLLISVSDIDIESSRTESGRWEC